MRNVSANTRKLTTLAMLAALAIVLVALIHFPLVPAAPFLEYDPADIPIFIGTFLFGPAAGLAADAGSPAPASVVRPPLPPLTG